MKLTKAKAKELSIRKWELIVLGRGSDFGIWTAMPELYELTNSCGYCEKYMHINLPVNCGKCPIRPPDYVPGSCGCNYDNHPFQIWNENRTTKKAQAVLDLIKKS
jgi:hypothetical protein